ncbi:hypothetical protein [Bathymodiolus platifrons methanotrophic gill symbiont]|uniref:hypothetical protein n=1 Tax=Bathymodiolus platifrons methanotrophic gill symbiont TaxID=113268 RepID=UPI000B41E377|nr:hypothetical protein [Bathymodiolus platifrons methanotrophic gill symbiont]
MQSLIVLSFSAKTNRALPINQCNSPPNGIRLNNKVTKDIYSAATGVPEFREVAWRAYIFSGFIEGCPLFLSRTQVI